MSVKPALQVVDSEDTSGLGKPLPVKLSRIERFEGQPRRYFDQKNLEELADSIEERGQDTPVKVCKHSQKPGAFVLIGGERRWRSFHIIKERRGGDPLVDCFIDSIRDERHHFREAFLDNLQREDLIPLDEAASYKRLYDESEAGSHHAKIVEIVKMSKKSFTHVENYLHMDMLPDEVKRMMDPLRSKEERLTTTAAIDIARSTRDPKLQLSIAKESIERNLGVVEVRALIGVKTGKTGYGISGRLRKPSDDYKMLKIFFGGTLNRLRRIRNGIDIEGLYGSRDDEFGDRERDAKIIREMTGHLKELLEQIEAKK